MARRSDAGPPSPGAAVAWPAPRPAPGQAIDRLPCLWHAADMLVPPDDLSDDQIEVFQQALEFYQAGARHRAQRELAEAMVAFRRSLALFPSAAAYLRLAEVYGLTQRNLDAVEACHRALACEPENGEALLLLGECWSQFEDDEKALDAFRRASALAHFPGRARALFALAAALEKKLRWQEAYDVLEECCALDGSLQKTRHALHRMLGHLN